MKAESHTTRWHSYVACIYRYRADDDTDFGHCVSFTQHRSDRLFDSVVAMTQGGPGTASEVPAKFIMDHLFGRANCTGFGWCSDVLVPVVVILASTMYARSRKAVSMSDTSNMNPTATAPRKARASTGRPSSKTWVLAAWACMLS